MNLSVWTARDRALSITIGLMAGAAWLALWMMGSSPHAAVHHHGSPDVTAPVASLLLFVGSWTVMTAAMMLPTSLPILRTFEKLAGARPDRARLLALVVAGYLMTWTLFGVCLYFGRAALQQLALAHPWLDGRSDVTAGGLLIVAGLYQFTPLKRRCLDKCRSPLSFVISH